MAFSSEVDTGSREENASKKEIWSSGSDQNRSSRLAGSAASSRRIAIAGPDKLQRGASHCPGMMTSKSSSKTKRRGGMSPAAPQHSCSLVQA
jgi:hypothetical protein